VDAGLFTGNFIDLAAAPVVVATCTVALAQDVWIIYFFYAVLHAMAWSWWDQGLELNAMLADVWKRPFIMVGMAAFLTMSLLALTSTKGWMRRLGRRWQQLHRLIYLIALLSILHYWWHKSGKSDFTTVSIYACVLVVLLAWRLFKWKANRR